MLIETLKKDQLQARKERDKVKADLLTTLISECEKKGKDAGNRLPTDEEITSTIKAFLKSIGIFKKESKDEEWIKHLAREEEILKEYLPVTMSEEEVKAVLTELKSRGVTGIKDVMAYFKDNLSGQYDGSMVSRLSREV